MEPSAQANVDLELPKRIGRYEAFLQIGAGGMARVYLGVQNGPFSVKKMVVIKQVRQEIASDQQYLEMFIDEASIALRLNHPNVVHTYEVLDEAPDYYLVMEFLDGQSLLEVLRRVGRQKFPLHEHIWILTQLLAGLHYAHELRDFDGKPLNIVHRDVTPSNVFVCRSGTVKLLDFGIAKASGAVAATRNGMLKGKLGYVAPEQCLGHPAGVRSDIYAVGVMLWEAMARRRRVSGETQAAQIHARIQGSEPPIERVWPQAPPALAAIARRALSVQPEQRYATARDFQRDLEKYLAQKQSRAGAESVSRLLRPHFERERAALYRAIEAQFGAAHAHGVAGSGTSSSVSVQVPLSSPEPTSMTAPSVSITPPPSQLVSGVVSQPSSQSASWRAPAPVSERVHDDDAKTSPVEVDDALLRASKPDSAFTSLRRQLSAELQRSGARFGDRLRTLVFAVVALRIRRSSAFALGAGIAAVATLYSQMGTPDSRLPAGAASSLKVATPESVAGVPLPSREEPKRQETLAAEMKLSVDPAMDLSEAEAELNEPHVVVAPEPQPAPLMELPQPGAPLRAAAPPIAAPVQLATRERAPEAQPDPRAAEPSEATPSEPPPPPRKHWRRERERERERERDEQRTVADSRRYASPRTRAEERSEDASEELREDDDAVVSRSDSSARSSRYPSSRWARARAARLAQETRLSGFSSLEPGMDIRPPQQAQRSIDEEDPYEP